MVTVGTCSLDLLDVAVVSAPVPVCWLEEAWLVLPACVEEDVELELPQPATANPSTSALLTVAFSTRPIPIRVPS
jgi:hypothetical protein